jgi:CYTH domain-containing protein
MFEIERRFLIHPDYVPPYVDAAKVEKVTQGYMSVDPEKIIRIRYVECLKTFDVEAYLTIKGKTHPGICGAGFTKMEIETEINPIAASSMLSHFCGDQDIIEKIRYTIPVGDLLWEVDVFRTNNQGLIIAEVELDSEEQRVEIPYWVGKEITHDHRYSNSGLSQRPYPFEKEKK